MRYFRYRTYNGGFVDHRIRLWRIQEFSLSAKRLHVRHCRTTENSRYYFGYCGFVTTCSARCASLRVCLAVRVTASQATGKHRPRRCAASRVLQPSHSTKKRVPPDGDTRFLVGAGGFVDHRIRLWRIQEFSLSAERLHVRHCRTTENSLCFFSHRTQRKNGCCLKATSVFWWERVDSDHRSQ